MDLSAIALKGIAQAEVQLEAAATSLASAGAATPDGANLDVVDISKEMVALMSAQTLFALNISTLKTADQIQKAVIDLTA
jgi:flagellar hook protein FlgE